MPLEVINFIGDLNANNPLGSDVKSEGDDHIRGLKRALATGTFANFVGTTAAPKTVALTEDQISDAALKSAGQTISGAWRHTTDLSFDNDTFIFMDTLGNAQLVRMLSVSAANVMTFGSNQGFATTGEMLYAGNFDMLRGGLVSARFLHPDDGGMLCGMRGSSVLKKTGFRNPLSNVQDASYTLQQSDEGQIVHFVSGPAGQVYTVPVLEAGTSITIINDDQGDDLILRESGVALSALLGGAQLNAAPDLTIAVNSVVQLHWFDTVTVKCWGNGIS